MSSAGLGPISSIPIGQLAQRTGCNIETIRYYERAGLLPVPRRNGRFRRYDREDVRRLAFVRRARGLGLTLDEVRSLLGLAAGGEDVCGEAREIAVTHLADVRTKIADLQAMERALADAVCQCGAGEAPGCPLISALKEQGPSAPDQIAT